VAQQRWSIVLDKDLRFKTQPSREAEIPMRGTRIAIDTAVLTSSIGVDTSGKSHVRTRIGREDGARRVFEKLGRGAGSLESVQSASRTCQSGVKRLGGLLVTPQPWCAP